LKVHCIEYDANKGGKRHFCSLCNRIMKSGAELYRPAGINEYGAWQELRQAADAHDKRQPKGGCFPWWTDIPAYDLSTLTDFFCDNGLGVPPVWDANAWEGDFYCFDHMQYQFYNMRRHGFALKALDTSAAANGGSGEGFSDTRFWSEQSWTFSAADNRRFCEQVNPLWTCALDPHSCPGAFIAFHRDRMLLLGW
jgi:hypothetical protein